MKRFLLNVLLFFVLTPDVLVKLPPRGSKYLVAFVHAILFAVAHYFLCTCFKHVEGFQDERPYQCCDADKVCTPNDLCTGEHVGRECPGPDDKPKRTCIKV